LAGYVGALETMDVILAAEDALFATLGSQNIEPVLL
jgi:hypothetical protein